MTDLETDIDTTELAPLAVVDRDSSTEDLAKFGGGRLAYVTIMRSDDVEKIYPGAPTLPPGQELFALVNADGTPILLTDDRNTAEEGAWNHNLETVTLH